jgi:hypothetical protein
LEKLARELEEMDAEFQRRRQKKEESGSSAVSKAEKDEGEEGKPPVPDKTDEGADDPPLPAKPLPALTSPSNLTSDLATKTTIEGDGGASLSAPLVEIEPLRLSGRERANLKPDEAPTKVDVEPISALEQHFAETPLAVADEADAARRASVPPTSAREVATLKASLNGDGAAGEASPMPHFGVEDMVPAAARRDEVDERVINAIRGGEL